MEEQLSIPLKSKSQEKNQNSSSSFELEYEPVKNTIWTLIKQEPKGKWEIAIGNSIASPKKFKTKWAARKFIKTKPWELLFILAYEAGKNGMEEKIKQLKTEEK